MNLNLKEQRIIDAVEEKLKLTVSGLSLKQVQCKTSCGTNGYFEAGRSYNLWLAKHPGYEWLMVAAIPGTDKVMCLTRDCFENWQAGSKSELAECRIGRRNFVLFTDIFGNKQLLFDGFLDAGFTRNFCSVDKSVLMRPEIAFDCKNKKHYLGWAFYRKDDFCWWEAFFDLEEQEMLSSKICHEAMYFIRVPITEKTVCWGTGFLRYVENKLIFEI